MSQLITFITSSPALSSISIFVKSIITLYVSIAVPSHDTFASFSIVVSQLSIAATTSSLQIHNHISAYPFAISSASTLFAHVYTHVVHAIAASGNMNLTPNHTLSHGRHPVAPGSCNVILLYVIVFAVPSIATVQLPSAVVNVQAAGSVSAFVTSPAVASLAGNACIDATSHVVLAQCAYNV